MADDVTTALNALRRCLDDAGLNGPLDVEHQILLTFEAIARRLVDLQEPPIPDGMEATTLDEADVRWGAPLVLYRNESGVWVEPDFLRRGEIPPGAIPLRRKREAPAVNELSQLRALYLAAHNEAELWRNKVVAQDRELAALRAQASAPAPDGGEVRKLAAAVVKAARRRCQSARCDARMKLDEMVCACGSEDTFLEGSDELLWAIQKLAAAFGGGE